MTNWLQYGYRLDLPDDWSPGYYWCAQFRIPGGVQYVEHLSAALGMLTLEKTWAKDPTGDGAKTVAHTWEDALYERPLKIDQEDCVYLYPPISTDEDRANVAAAIIQNWIEPIIQSMIAAIETSVTFDAWYDANGGGAAWGGGFENVKPIAQRVWNGLVPLTHDERGSYSTDCTYLPVFNDVKHGLQVNENFVALQAMIDAIEGLNAIPDPLFWEIVTMMQMDSLAALLSYAYDHGGGGGGAGFGGDCTWEHEFDFTVDQHGFEARHFPGYTDPVWISGVGWKVDGNNDHDTSAYIRRAIPASRFTRIVTRGYIVAANDGSSAITGYDGANFYGLVSPLVDGANVSDWSGSAMISDIGGGINGNGPNPSACWVTSMRVEGSGIDPFF